MKQPSIITDEELYNLMAKLDEYVIGIPADTLPFKQAVNKLRREKVRALVRLANQIVTRQEQYRHTRRYDY